MTSDLTDYCLTTTDTWSTATAMTYSADLFVSSTVDFSQPAITIEDQTISVTDLSDDLVDTDWPCEYTVLFNQIADLDYTIKTAEI